MKTFIMLHLQVEQMRYGAGPLLLLFMFLHCLLSVHAVLFYSILFCLYLPLSASGEMVHCCCNSYGWKKRKEINVISAIRCPFPQTSWCLFDIHTLEKTCSLSMSLWVTHLPGDQRKERKRIPPAPREGSETGRTFREHTQRRIENPNNV